MMIGGLMQIPWYYTSVILHFARNAASLSLSLRADYRDEVIELDDESTRWWFPLRQDCSYHYSTLQKIALCERQSITHGPIMLPLSKMLYDVILYKMLYYNTIFKESWRQEFESVMLRYLARHTIDQEAQWVDKVIEEGWTLTKGYFYTEHS